MKLFTIIIMLFAFFSCESLQVDDTNATSADRATVQNLVNGIQSQIKIAPQFYTLYTSVVAREAQYLQSTDPRFWTLYKDNSAIASLNGGFIGTRVWNTSYLTLRNLNNFEDLQTSSSNIAFAKTIKAIEYLNLTNLYSDIRQDVKQYDKLGKVIKTRAANYTFIAKLLDDAYASLTATGAKEFDFTYDQFVTPNGGNSIAEFAKFNRALRARVAVYQQDWATAITAVGNSFLDDSKLQDGVFYKYSDANGDAAKNPVWRDNSKGGVDLLAHNNVRNDANAAGELARLSVTTLSAPRSEKHEATKQSYTSSYGITKYKDNKSPYPIITNKELLLIRAEAKIGLGGANLASATTDLNLIRAQYGLTPLVGNATVDQMLHERRFELFMEGHRWIDLIRYNKLNSTNLPKDFSNDGFVDTWATPSNEAGF